MVRATDPQPPPRPFRASPTRQRTRTILDQASAALKALAAKLKQHAEKAGSAKTLKGVRASLPSLASAGVRNLPPPPALAAVSPPRCGVRD